MSMSEIFRFSNLEDKVAGTLIFVFPVFFLTIKGHSNLVAGLIFLTSLLCISANPRDYLCKQDRLFWILWSVLAFPFVAELIVQCGRGQVVAATLDAPSRFFLASVVFIFLTRVRIDTIALLAKGSALSVVITSLSVLMIRDYYWGHRAATYFVDPISLPVYLLACLAIASYSLLASRKKILYTIVSIVLVSLATIVCLLSYSRTSWLAFLAFLFVLLFLIRRYELRIFAWGSLISIVSVIWLFNGADLVISRLHSVYVDLLALQKGSLDFSATTIRVGLAWMDWKLFMAFPLGVADGALPPIEWFASNGMEVSEILYDQKLLSGSHNEILAHLSRKGLLGIPTIICLFLFPLCYFLIEAKKSGPVGCVGKSALLFLVVIFVSSLLIQVLNLKMTATFYSFSIAIFFAACYRTRELKS